MSDFWEQLAALASNDVKTLKLKDQSYGSSWKRRGGVGAFMMAARKWDRLENILGKDAKYDIFQQIVSELKKNISDGILDDIQDLRCYLLLIETEARRLAQQPEASKSEYHGLVPPKKFGE